MPKRRKNIEIEPPLPDAEQLLVSVRESYRGKQLSPEARLQSISHFSEDNRFRTYALIVAQTFLAHNKTRELDSIFDGPENIDLTVRDRWVSNTANLTRNAIDARLTDFMARYVHPELGVGELADEVWAVLRPHYEELVRAQKAESEQQRLLAQSAVARLPGFSIGPGGIIGGPVHGPQHGTQQPKKP